jgi:hypothetical protein
VVDTDFVSAPNSEEVIFGWAGTDPASWCRLTTFNVANVPNPAIDYTKALVFQIRVTQGDFILSFLTRDNGTLVAIGANGGATGEIEEIIPAGGPIHLDASVNSNWQEVAVAIPAATIGTLTGDSILDFTTGTIEAFRVAIGTSSTVTFYIDDLRQVDIPAAVQDWLYY